MRMQSPLADRMRFISRKALCGPCRRRRIAKPVQPTSFNSSISPIMDAVDHQHWPIRPRKKRRPALACEQCRRRKIKCDRASPCEQCVKSDITDCYYVSDSRVSLTTAPFEAEDTHFSVFEIPQSSSSRSSLSASVSGLTSAAGNFEEGASSSLACPSKMQPSVSLKEFLEGDMWSNETLTNWDPDLDLDLMNPTIDSVYGSAETAVVSPKHLGGPVNQSSRPSSQQSISSSYIPDPNFLQIPYTLGSFQGDIPKIKFRGRSHWSHCIYESPEMTKALRLYEAEAAEKGWPTLGQCKVLSSSIRAKEYHAATKPISALRELVPNKADADLMVKAYLRTFQPVFGILHVPTFRQEYASFWADQTRASEVFVVTLLILCSLGLIFCLPEIHVLKSQAACWLSVSLKWIRACNSKTRQTLEALRVMCLILLARQCHSVSGEIAWLSSGVVRTAMSMGLHSSPMLRYTQQSSPSVIESERRLFATAIELELQSSLDCGAMPGINIEHYAEDALPVNVDDHTLEAGTSFDGLVVPSKPLEIYTQSSFQVLLMKTAPIRLKISRFINSPRSNYSHEEARTLSTEMKEVLESCSELISSYCMSSTPPMNFQLRLFESLVQKFVLALHHHFAAQALSDHSYLHFRKACLEACAVLAMHLTQPGDDDFSRLLLCGKGVWRTAYIQSSLYLGRELIQPMAMGEATFNFAGRRKEWRRAVDKFLQLTESRIRGGGNKSIKSYVFVSCLVAQADASKSWGSGVGMTLSSSSSVGEAISQALRRSLETAHTLLKKHDETRDEMVEG